MNKLALELPGGQNITDPQAQFTDLGGLISGLFTVAIFIAAFLSFIWLVWGAFQYIVAGGNKENLAKARARITWAIVGLLLTLIAFLVAQFAAQILPSSTGAPII